MPAPSTLGGTKLAVGAVLLVVGYLIKYRQWTWLVSEASALVSPTDETAPLVGSLFGNVSLAVGGALLLVGTVQFLGVVGTVPDWILLLLLAGAVVLVAPRMSYELIPE